MTQPALRKNQRITMKLQAHSVLSDNFQCQGMDRDQASRAAFNAVRDMSDAKLRKLCDA